MNKRLLAISISLALLLLGGTVAASAADLPLPPLPDQILSEYFLPFEGSLDEHQHTLSDLVSRAEAGSEGDLAFEGSLDTGVTAALAYTGAVYDVFLVYDLENGEDVYAYAYAYVFDRSLRGDWESAWSDHVPKMLEAIASAGWIDSGYDDPAYSARLDQYSAELADNVEAVQRVLINLDPQDRAPYFGHWLSAFRTEVDEARDCYWFVLHNTPAGSERPDQPEPEPEQSTKISLQLPSGLEAFTSSPLKGTAEEFGTAICTYLSYSSTAGDTTITITTAYQNSNPYGDGLVIDVYHAQGVSTGPEGSNWWVDPYFVLRSEDGRQVYAVMSVKPIPRFITGDREEIVESTNCEPLTEEMAFIALHVEAGDPAFEQTVYTKYTDAYEGKIVAMSLDLILGTDQSVTSPVYGYYCTVKTTPLTDTAVTPENAADAQDACWFILHNDAERRPDALPEAVSRFTTQLGGTYFTAHRKAMISQGRLVETFALQGDLVADHYEVGAAVGAPSDLYIIYSRMYHWVCAYAISPAPGGADESVSATVALHCAEEALRGADSELTALPDDSGVTFADILATDDPNTSCVYDGFRLTSFRDLGRTWLVVHNTELGAPASQESAAALPALAATLNAPMKGTPASTRDALRAWSETLIRNASVSLAGSGARDGCAWELWRADAAGGAVDMYLLLDATGEKVLGFAWPFTLDTESGSGLNVFLETAVQMDSGFDGDYAQILNGYGYPDNRAYRSSIDWGALSAVLESAFMNLQEDTFTQASAVIFGHNLTILREGDTYWCFYHNSAVDGLSAVDAATFPPQAGPAQPASTAQDASHWACPSCGAVNSGAKCIVCGTERPFSEPEPEPAQEDAHWACPSCGAINNSGAKCVICGTERPSVESEQEPAPALMEDGIHWTCPNCGAVNSGNNCLVCQTAKPKA